MDEARTAGGPAGEADVLAWMRTVFGELPIAALLGARPVGYNAETGAVTIEYAAQPGFCNLVGNVQGGMLTAMLDNVMSFAALARLGPGHIVPTLEIKTSYIRPARPGRITGEGRALHQGRSVAFLEGALRDDSGALLATGSSTALLRRRSGM